MRYVIQIGAMLGDVLVLLAVAWVMHAVYIHALNPWFLLVVPITAISWLRSGGFNNWIPANIRQFMKNAKDYGL